MLERHTREYGHFPLSYEYNGPILPLMDTLDIVNRMPKDQWVLPIEPFTTFEKIRENDLDFMKEHKRERFKEYCEDIIVDWVVYLNTAERGRQRVEDLVENGIISGDLPGIQAFNSFLRSTKSTAENSKDLSELKELIFSSKKAFLKLLSKENVEKLREDQIEEISEEDIMNAKHLINSFSIRYCGMSIREE